MSAERTQDGPDMVAGRVVGDAELGGDLGGAEAVAEQPQGLELAGRQLRFGGWPQRLSFR